MPEQTRLNDYCTGHDACSPVPLVTASNDVFINNLGAGRIGDLYAVHGCIIHPPHQDYIAEGSSSVFINGRAAARIGDPAIIAGFVRNGSSNVFVGG